MTSALKIYPSRHYDRVFYIDYTRKFLRGYCNYSGKGWWWLGLG